MQNMNKNITYIPSKILAGNTEILRQHSFTRWMSRDLMQATVDYCKNIGLYPLYCEASPDHLARCLFWRLPQGAITEVRSWRTKRQRFMEHTIKQARRNNRKLIISSCERRDDVYFCPVWVSSDYCETAKNLFTAYGITCAERKEIANPAI